MITNKSIHPPRDKKAEISAGPHGDFSLGQLAGMVHDAHQYAKEAYSMMIIIDGSGFDSFADMDDDQQKAIFTSVTRGLFVAIEKIQALSDILDFAEVKA